MGFDIPGHSFEYFRGFLVGYVLQQDDEFLAAKTKDRIAAGRWFHD